MFVDKLAEEVKKVGGAEIVSLLLFADDIVLVAENPKMLQEMLDVVHEFSRKYRFMFNSNKSEVMIFGKQHKRRFRLVGAS